MHSKVLIVGSGPAGYTAGVYAARAMLEPILISGFQPGGQLTITTEVENWPGHTEIQGPDLMVNMEAHAKSTGVKIVDDHVTELLVDRHPFMAITDKGSHYSADSIILATGAQAKWLGLPSEEKFKGFGVSACATCDGFFYRNKKVVVIGGGNTAAEEAIFLTKFADKVTLIHRRDTLRAERILQNRLTSNEKINLLWNHELTEILGSENPLGVEGIKVKNVTDGSEKNLECDGVFVAIGHDPSTSVFKDKVKLDKDNYVITEKGGTNTSVPGIFAAGDCVDKIYRQAVTAAGMGCMAALDAEKWLAEKK